MKPDRTALDYLELFRSGSWFRATPADFQQRVLRMGVLRTLKTGQHLLSRGSLPAGLYGVVDGAIRLRSLGQSGREALLRFLDPPSWFGEIGLFDGLPLTHDAIADVPSLIVHVPRGPLEALLKEQPGYWFEFGRLMAQHMRLSLLSMGEVALEAAPIRLARRLLLIAQNYGDLHGHSTRVIEVRQEELAMMLSISRQTTNQLLKQLEAQGIVGLRYGEIEILDLEKLREVVAGTG